MSVIKFIRDIARYFKYPSDDNPTTQQEYQNAVKNWVATETSLVDTILWQPETSYAVGTVVKTPSIAAQNVLYCATAGVSGSSEPSYSGKSVGDSVSDGTVTWEICRVMPFIASKSVGGNIPIRLLVTGNSYKGIEVLHTDGNRVGNIRFTRTSTSNEITLGASNGNNDAPTGITVSRGLNDDFIYLKSPAQGLSTSNTFFNVYLNTSNPSSASPSMQLNASTLNLYGKNIYDAKNLYFNGTGNIFGYKTNGAFSIFCGSNDENPSMTFWGAYSSSNAGYFRLRSTMGGNNKDLVGRPDGTLTWNGLDISPQTLTTVVFDDKNIATGTRTSLGTFSLTKGTWIIVASASFANNATGYRYLGISDTATGNQLSRYHSVSCAAASGIATHIIFTTIHYVTATTTFYLTAHQTSGSTLSITNAGVRLFRLSHDA